MFSLQAGAINKLVQLGMNRQWAEVLRTLLGNPNAPLYHRAPVTIQLPTGSQIPTNARLQPRMSAQGVTTAINTPNQLADSTKIAPALTLDGGEWSALHITNGATTIRGSGVTVFAPTTHNEAVYHNAPVTFASNIRMMGLDANNGGIFKFDQPSFGAVLARVAIGAQQGSTSGSAGEVVDTYTVQRIDENESPVGVPFTAYDPLNRVTSRRTCNSSPGTADRGWVCYMSDRAAGGPTADTAIKPNIGGWDIVEAGDSNPNNSSVSFTFVAKICCINQQLVVCTQTVSICAPGNVGAVDCGGSGSCT